MTFTIPPLLIAALALTASILCYLSFRKSQNMLRSSIVLMFQVGMMFLGPTCVAIGILYAYFELVGPDIFLRQNFVRILLVYLLGGINIWQILILQKGRNL